MVSILMCLKDLVSACLSVLLAQRWKLKIGKTSAQMQKFGDTARQCGTGERREMEDRLLFPVFLSSSWRVIGNQRTKVPFEAISKMPCPKNNSGTQNGVGKKSWQIQGSIRKITLSHNNTQTVSIIYVFYTLFFF